MEKCILHAPKEYWHTQLLVFVMKREKLKRPDAEFYQGYA